MKKMKQILTIVFLFSAFVGFLNAQCEVVIVPSESSETICESSGESVTLNAFFDSSDENCAGEFNFIWSTFQTSPSITIDNSGTYSVTITNIEDDSNTSEDDIDYIFVENPDVSISGPPQTNLCVGDMITLTGSPTGGTWVSSSMGSLNVTNNGGNTTTLTAQSSSPNVVITYTAANSAGCTGTAIRDFSVNSTTAEIMGTNSLCEGSTGNLTAFPPGGTWGSLNDDVVFVSQTGQITALGDIGNVATITYTVSINGCTGIDTHPVSIINSLNSNIQVLSCMSNTLILQDNPGEGYGPYVWNIESDPLEAATLEPSTTNLVTVNVLPSLISAVITVNFTDATGCQGEGSFTISGDDFPNPNITIDPQDNNPLCIDEEVVLCVNLGSEMIFNEWTILTDDIVDPGATNTGSCFELTGMNAGSTVIQYRATSPIGCIAFDTVTISVEESPSANPGEDKETCIGEDVTLVAINPGENSILWSPSGLTTPSITIPINMDHTETLKLTSSNGCTDMNEVEILAYSPPAVNIEGPSSTCGGDDFVLSAVPIGSSLPTDINYEWTRIDGEGNGVIVGSDITLSIVDIQENTEFQVVMTYQDANGEDLCNSITSSVHSVNVVNLDPVANNVFDSSNTVCQNSVSIFENSNQELGTINSWKVLCSETTDTIIAGDFLIVKWGSVAIGGNCAVRLYETPETGSDCIDSIDIFVNFGAGSAPDPAEIFRADINDILVYNDSTVTCYQWGYIDEEEGNVTDILATHQSYIPDPYMPDRIYWCRAWNGDCNDDACSTIAIYRNTDGTTSEEDTSEAKFSLYPNPNDGSFHLDINRLYLNAEYDIHIVNALGQTVHRQSIQTDYDRIQTDLQINARTSGLYYLLMYHNGVRQRVETFVVQK